MKQGLRIPLVAGAVVLGAAILAGASSNTEAWARVASSKGTSKASVKTSQSKIASSKSRAAKAALPRYVSLETLKTLRELRAARPKNVADPLLPVLAPNRLDGKDFGAIPKNLQSLPFLGDPVGKDIDWQRLTRSSAQRRTPSFPRPIAPARIARGARTTTPRWVRYPLEFQLAGIGLGTLAVNKDRYNRIDRYGLFAMHGNPTAIVTPILRERDEQGNNRGENAGGQGESTTGGNADAPKTLTVQQQPPEYSPRFGLSQNGNIPAWANACIVDLDENHVEWLYNRGTYAMGFVVDRLGYVDGIVVAGIQSNIANTQLEDPEHTIKLGDDLRKVLFRYGYPDSFSTYLVTIADGQLSAGTPGAENNGARGAGAGGAGAGGAGAGGQQTNTTGPTNGVHRIFEVRYEQSYNIVFTISYNRVIRMYIFGDPDYFTEARRRNLRTSY